MFKIGKTADPKLHFIPYAIFKNFAQLEVCQSRIEICILFMLTQESVRVNIKQIKPNNNNNNNKDDNIHKNKALKL